MSDRYSGFHGTTLNPTSFISSPIDTEINVFGLDFELESDYGYIKNSSYLDLPSSFSNLKITNPYIENEIDDLSLNIFEKKDPYTILSSVLISGPSYIFKVKEANKIYSYGLGINQRINLSALKFNSGYNYNNFRKENFGNEILFDDTNSGLIGANWTELKFNFSTSKKKNDSFIESIGFNFKINIPYTSLQINQESPTKMIYQNLETLIFFNDFSTESKFYTDTAIFKKRGLGFSLDLGYSIYKKKTQSKKRDEYVYKLGISVLDLGFLNFNNLSEVHKYDIFGPRNLDIEDVKNYKDMSERVYGDRDRSFVKASYNIYTPLSLSVQFDYNFYKSLYFNTTILNRLNFGDDFLKRSNILNSSVRIEKREYSIILNGSFYEYKKISLGLSSRIGPLIFSINNISNMFHKSDKLNHVEFMIGIKAYQFYKKPFYCKC